VNTGGEKVFPEEVEEVLKTHPSVRDAVVIGVPDVRFGEAVCAVVAPTDGASIELETLAAHVKQQLAAFKAPRHVVVIDAVDRAPNGKVDHRAVRALAFARLGFAPKVAEGDHR
jgi:fatty-acyl-CoA synthase